MSDVTHPSPQSHRVSLAALLFGACAAPIFWLGQLMLGFGVSAYACYPADHPVLITGGKLLRSALVGFDIVAVVAALAGGLTAFGCLRAVAQEKEAGSHAALQIGEGRARFLALWGLFSSLWFFFAILFNAIASLTVPLCVQ